MLHGPYFVLLNAFAQRLQGVDPAAFVREQSLQIAGRRIDFSLERDLGDAAEDRLIVRCAVLRLPAPASEEICRFLLRADNLWAGTLGATLGLRGDDEVVLSESARMGSLDARGLLVLVAGLCRQAESWAAELMRQTSPSPAIIDSMLVHLRA